MLTLDKPSPLQSEDTAGTAAVASARVLISTFAASIAVRYIDILHGSYHIVIYTQTSLLTTFGHFFDVGRIGAPRHLPSSKTSTYGWLACLHT